MRPTVLFFSPTGGVRKAASLLAEAIAGDADYVDLSLTLHGQRDLCLTQADVCVIAVPSFGGRVPEIAARHLASIRGGGARAVLVSVYGNRSDEDTLPELRDIARAAGFFPVAAVRAIAEHSIVRSIAAGRPDDEDARTLARFGREIRSLLSADAPVPVDLPEKARLRPYGGVPMHPRTSRRCTGCGKCATLCPAGAIPRENPALTDEKACITCMRCVAICPQHARSLSPVALALVGRKLKKACAERKEPELILGKT